MSDIEEYATEYPFDTGYQWIEQIKAENAALRERVAELEKEVAALEAENIEYTGECGETIAENGCMEDDMACIDPLQKETNWNSEYQRLRSENAALRKQVEELEAENETLNNALAMCDTQYFSEYWHDFLEYLEDKKLPRSRSVGACGSVYPFGGRETETR